MDISKIQKLQREMINERDWDQFHSPKNLVVSAAVEANELLEIFQWVSEEDSYKISENPKKLQAIKDEVADVLFYLLRLSDKLNIDVETALLEKMEKSKAKYPVEKSKGRITKYDEL